MRLCTYRNISFHDQTVYLLLLHVRMLHCMHGFCLYAYSVSCSSCVVLSQSESSSLDKGSVSALCIHIYIIICIRHSISCTTCGHARQCMGIYVYVYKHKDSKRLQTIVVVRQEGILPVPTMYACILTYNTASYKL